MKLSLKDKRKIIETYKTEYCSYECAGKAVGCSSKVAELIIKQYELHGEKALTISKKQNHYSEEFKKKMVDLVESGRTITSLTVEYNLHTTSTIRRWIKIFEQLGYNGLKENKRGRPKMKPKETKTNENAVSPLTDKERQEFEEMKKKLEYLEMENEYLKKLDALVQERLKREKKK